MTFDADDPFKLHWQATKKNNEPSAITDFEWDHEDQIFGDNWALNCGPKFEETYTSPNSLFSQILPVEDCPIDSSAVSEILSDIEDNKNPLMFDSPSPLLSSIAIPDPLSSRPDSYCPDFLVKEEKIDNKVNLSNKRPISNERVLTFAAFAKAVTDYQKNDIKMVVSPPPHPGATIPNISTLKNSFGSVIRVPVPVKRTNTANTGLKAIVIGPNRSKSILCDVVRTSNKGVIIQKPVDQTWLNLTSGIRNESSKLPIKVKITTKENCVPVKSLVNSNRVPIFLKQKTPSNLSTPTVTVNLAKSALIPVNNIKVETDKLQAEISQSSNKVFEPSSPFLSLYNEEIFEEPCTPFIADEDDMSGDSYKCFPLAQVTGHQVQPPIPDIFKYTPNNSPTSYGNDSDSCSLFSKCTNSNNQFYNKAAADVDHDYGFLCRAPQSNASLNTIFNVTSLGIQTPSASEPSTSEPSTDADDDDLDDIFMNEDFDDCEELEREQKEYFGVLARQLKSAESVNKPTGDLSSPGPSTSRAKKPAARPKQRKAAPATKRVIESTSSNNLPNIVEAINISSPTKTSRKRAAPRPEGMAKKKKGAAGRTFSYTERQQHNKNEQSRRIDLKNFFEDLRQLVPALVPKERAAKVEILTKAKLHCDQLRMEDINLQAEKTYLRARQKRLMALWKPLYAKKTKPDAFRFC